MTKTLAALLVLGLLDVATASAQTYPSRTITIVSPAPAGGVTDIIGRALAQRFGKAFGQQAVVENKPGANNQLAAEFVVNSPPDGHTLFIAPDGTFVANPSLYPKLPYDPYKSFTPISGLMIINHGLILSKGFAPNNVAELIVVAGLVLDHRLLAERLAEPLGQRPADDVGDAPGRRRRHDGDGLAGKGLRRRRHGHAERPEHQPYNLSAFHAGFLPGGASHVSARCSRHPGDDGCFAWPAMCH